MRLLSSRFVDRIGADLKTRRRPSTGPHDERHRAKTIFLPVPVLDISLYECVFKISEKYTYYNYSQYKKEACIHLLVVELGGDLFSLRMVTSSGG